MEARRRAAKLPPLKRENGRPPKLLGLALSGGGVRSATFNLGLLQALAAAGKLKAFDYLSTVSGGGYAGGWWSAWLSRDARNDERDPIFPPEEDIASERDDRRTAMSAAGSREHVDRPQIKDSAINAAEDPIHHLRLFSNVMTPRKGALSADTWRAIAVVGRNIILTWMILLPILLAAIMIAQAWFTLFTADPHDLSERVALALEVPGLLFIGSVVCATFWMLFSRRWRTFSDKLVAVLSTAAFFILTWYVIIVIERYTTIPNALYIALGLWVVYVCARLVWWKATRRVKWSDGDFWRNRLVNLQTTTLSYSVFTLVIFLFAALGHAAFAFLLSEKEAAVARSGGWSGFALALLSAVYTALKSAPTGGGDNRAATKKPPLLQRIIFAVAPLLLLLVLGIFLAWAGQELYELVLADRDLILRLGRGALISGFLFLMFALYEFRPPQRWKSLAPIAVWLAVLGWAYTVDSNRLKPYLVTIGVTSLALLAAALIFRALLRRRLWILYYALALAGTGAWIALMQRQRFLMYDEALPKYVIAGIVATAVLLIFELIQGRGANTRSIALTVIACTIFVLIGVAGSAGPEFGKRALTLVGLIATVLGWVVALGWLADPNLLTMHGFYKARLVRAYMGASNEERAKAKDADISDAVPGDDILLTAMRNTDRGAPYHLINTMLNLVGGSDLSTQARASDSFLMSKHFCGSTRTGYRPTGEYACGSISLGTAVAVSGAAASPTMGAQTPSAALSALMTLFNVRTGYWAPTPSLSYWRSGSARLWPVYTLEELLSQTTDLLPYSYLTDGGHYENTGVYSLIQRGCNVIVAGECGADPKTTLDDLGNLIRKVRIDFGTEITFHDEHIETLRSRPPGAHVMVGDIRYGDDHAKALGLTDAEKNGKLVIVKPNLAGGEPLDVKQYGYLHEDFPQQQTFDLWYDEAQFESYRRLGQESGKVAIETGLF
ncbi:MAG TPA: patatin-like phospholipase family protein [Thermoanaerobaculia bacterium]